MRGAAPVTADRAAFFRVHSLHKKLIFLAGEQKIVS